MLGPPKEVYFKLKYSCMVFSVPWNEMKMWHSLESYPHHGPNESSFCITSSRRQPARKPWYRTEREQPPTPVTPDHDDPSEKHQSTKNDLLDTTEIAGDVTLWRGGGGGRQSAGMQSDPFSFNLSTFGYIIWIGVRAQNLLRWMAVEHRCGLGGSPEGVKRFLNPIF
jgi:hypothetical protein